MPILSKPRLGAQCKAFLDDVTNNDGQLEPSNAASASTSLANELGREMAHGFFADLEGYGDAPALLSDGRPPVTYAELAAAADAIGRHVRRRDLVAVICRNDPDCIIGYVGLMRAGAALLLLHHTISRDHLEVLLGRFRPRYLYAPLEFDPPCPFEASRAVTNRYALTVLGSDPFPVHDDLCLLLTTSGTTGSRSLVRLSYRNVQSNAASIAQCLEISSKDRAITTMPMSYSYGLSIIHSHLLKGASIVLTEAPLVTPEFWKAVKTWRTTTFGGVPFHYDVLKKLKFENMELPALRYLTQAGGRLAPEMVSTFAEICALKQIKFIVMYGQTEATARISCLPWPCAQLKPCSIGIAVPGGELSLIDETGATIERNGVRGELRYRGPNVSMGYARSAEDLCNGDENGGMLLTGDIAYRDDEGCYYIVGRKKRFLKIFGHRVSLDELDALLREAGANCACAGSDDALKIYACGAADAARARAVIAAETRINPQGMAIVEVPAIPHTESGKVDYTALAAMMEARNA